jgi:putative transposase
MTLAIQTPASTPKGTLLSIPEVARRMGCSDEWARKHCRHEWVPKGLAMLLIPAHGGKPAWHVRPQADPSLLDRPATEFPRPSEQLPETARREALAKFEVVKRWQAFKADFFSKHLGNEQAATAKFIAVEEALNGRRVSRKSLFQWQRLHKNGGLAELADGRRLRLGGDGGGDDPFMQKGMQLWLDLRKPPATETYRMVCFINEQRGTGWNVPSFKKFQRFLAKIPEAVRIRRRDGEDAYVAQAEPYIERDSSALRSNEQWTADHHRLDVMVLHNGKHVRPWLTCFMDMRSRKIVGWLIYAHDPNGDVILAAFRDGCVSCGLPDWVYFDNGKDFSAEFLHGSTKQQRRKGGALLDESQTRAVFVGLGVQSKFCWAYHGQSKPVERFFGTVELWNKTWPTYVGNSTENKPENLQDQLARGHAPTLKEYIDGFGAWLAGYHSGAHGGDGMDGKSPDQIFAECLTEKRTATLETLDVLLMKPTRPLKVGRNGVTWKGLRYGQNEPALFPLLGKMVQLRVNDRDLSKVSVWGLDGSLLCVANANPRVPANATSAELRTAIAEKKRHRKTVTEYHRARPHLADDLPDLMARAKIAAANPAPDPNAAPPTIVPLNSPVEDQLPALRRAMKIAERPAADGAPSVSWGFMPREMRDRLSARVDRESEAEQIDSVDFHSLRARLGGSKNAG